MRLLRGDPMSVARVGARTGLSRLEPSDRWEALRLLRRVPERNAYLLAQIERGALTRDDLAGPVVGHFDRGALDGLCIFGSNLVVSWPASEASLASFAEYARHARFRIWVAVGEDRALARFMGYYGRRFRSVRVERGGQALYRLLPGRLPRDARTSELRPAALEEVGRLIEADRAMVLEELGFDPFLRDLELYRDGWHRRAREGRSWVLGEPGGEIVFKVDQSAASGDVIQLAGIWTAPAHRRQGLARLAVGEMCRRLLDEVPVLTLFVHEANVPAVRLYDGLGFEKVGHVRSVWFDP